MKTIKITLKNNKLKSIKKAVLILKNSLKKGDIIITKPRLSNIKLKILHFPSFIISKLSRGITHSCLYLGDENILEIGHTILDPDIQKISIEEFLKCKIRLFSGVTVYILHPKNYKIHQRNLVLKIAVDEFLKRSKSLVFSYLNMFHVAFNLLFKKKVYIKKEILLFKKDWNCSELISYTLKKAGIKIGKRRTSLFLPSTFIFSNHFKIKKKLILK